ncbi:MAG: diacylglycerol kinase [Nitrospirae bacterium]|nr:diacylglycerol kinase [Nitrospirota bacterium]MBF0540604.1 diacylglycerol kinase [Nitrospirota bacterium]
MPLRKWITSLNYAIEGILIAAKTEKHIRYHIVAASVVVIFSYVAGITRVEFLVVLLSVLSVIVTELINTAIEASIDLLSPDIHPKARIAKDTAAGAVLITAVGAAIVGYIILIPYIRYYFEDGLYFVKHSSSDVTMLSLIIVTVVVIITKALSGTGHPLRGGMPSGHAALSFSIWASITVITNNFVASMLSFILASVIAQSRVATKIHTRWEVILGGITGATITFWLFKIFN